MLFSLNRDKQSIQGNTGQSKIKSSSQIQPIVNFSLRKEVFFVALGSIVGAFTMHLPRVLLDFIGDSSYFLTLLISASVINSTEPIIGFLLHLFVATVIGIITGILLHTVIKFKISKVINGLTYGVIAGFVVFAVFAIPVSYLILGPIRLQSSQRQIQTCPLPMQLKRWKKTSQFK